MFAAVYVLGSALLAIYRPGYALGRSGPRTNANRPEFAAVRTVGKLAILRHEIISKGSPSGTNWLSE